MVNALLRRASRLDRGGYASVIFVQRRLIEAFATI
jgi:hypothetical protein